jgi:peptide/nickel transport system substrate-binding protein
VVFSWERFKSIGTRRSDLAHEFEPNAPVVSITAADDKTVVIKLHEPNATILSAFTVTAPGALHLVPREAADEKTLDIRNVQLGSGPWMATTITPSVGIFYKKHPSFGVDKRDVPYVDGMDMPAITEYATQLAQFRAGNLYGSQSAGAFPLRAEDVLPTKRDLSDLDMMQTDIGNISPRFFFGHKPESPFKDARVRQAWMQTIDRDLDIEVVFNTQALEAEGLPVETAWACGLLPTAWKGWWLDPKSKEFGPTAKYLQFDVAEAKKLLTAAGFPNGVDTDVHFPASGIPTAFYQQYPALVGMVSDSGLFRITLDPVNYNVDWTPKYRTIRGQFVGVGTWSPATGYPDPTNELFAVHHSSGGLFQGGDAKMDDLLKKALAEFDVKKRQALVHDVQRHEAEGTFYTRIGGASGFGLTWPVMRNVRVWRGGTGRVAATIFLDPERPPLKRA